MTLLLATITALADIERADCGDDRERPYNVGAIPRRGLAAAKHAVGGQDFRRHVLCADNAQASAFSEGGNSRQQTVIAAAEIANHLRDEANGLPIESDLPERRP